jgi:RHS repeat-associated protein
MTKQNIFLIVLINGWTNCFGQGVETVNDLLLSSVPVVSYLVNNEGRIVPGTSGVRIRGDTPFFIKANADYYGSPSPMKNFVRTEVMKPETSSLAPGLPTFGSFVKSIFFEYYDGLGSLKQTIKLKHSPSQKDLITFNQIDNFGRIATHYLPYTKKTGGVFRDSVLEEQLGFYSATSAVPVDSRPFGVNEFNGSPQNRIRKSFSAGWKWHEIKPAEKNVSLNDVSEVLKFTLGADDLPVYTGGQYFAKNALMIDEDLDEMGLITRTYRNMNGNVILEKTGDTKAWNETYYLYDRQGRLKFIFPPESIRRLSEFTANKIQFLDKWCFQFRYDIAGRVSEKKVPGAEWVLMIYDKWDRLVLTQDGNQRTAARWTFTKYDILNRPIITGFVTGSRAEMESGVIGETDRFEERARNATGYTNRCFPGHSEENLLVISYYDCYNFLTYDEWDMEGLDFNAKSIPGILDIADIFFATDPATVSVPVVKGYATGSKVKMLTDGKTRWLNSVNYYNRQYQMVQTASENHLGGIDRVSALFDKHSGVVYRTQRAHSGAPTSLTIFEEFVYDHSDRLLKSYYQINDAPKVLMVSNKYNEIGQLIEKNLHSTDEKTFLQSIDYRYNIQGWLTHINNRTLTNDGKVNDDEGDLFGMEFIFNDALSLNNGVFAPALNYDGNVAAISWKTNTLQTGVNSQEQIYGFQYDRFRRLTQSYYASNLAGAWRGAPALFNESIAHYDANGNIGGQATTGLSRYGMANGSRALIDDLFYRYNGNQLRNIKDNSAHISGFTDKPGVDLSADEYYYDLNGNLIEDFNRSITRISYNHLNLPMEVEFMRVSPVRKDKIIYTYDATGNKLCREVLIGEKSVWKSDYVNGIQYDNGTVSFISTSEGRAVSDGTSFNLEYFLKDHQNNTRVVCGIYNETDNYLATMETGLETQEKNTYKFSNISESRAIGNNITLSSAKVLRPNRSARCNGYSDSTFKATPIGPAKKIDVKSGDAIYVEVYGRFNNVRTNSDLIIPSLLSAFVTTAITSGVESPELIKNIYDAAPLAAAKLTYEDIVPKGYLVLMYFGIDDQFIRAEAVRITESSYKAFEKLQLSFTAEKDGRIFIYVANESHAGATVDVFFDDLYIVHQKNEQKAQVFQAADYYPFGSRFNEYEKDRLKIVATDPVPRYEPLLRNRYLFQGQELQKDLNLGWYQFRYRMHDPTIGRFASVDPLAGDYVHFSPYSFSGNQLLNAIELEGKEPKAVFETVKFISPVAFKFDFSFTSHDMRIGYNVSLGVPKGLPFSVRKEFGASFNARDIIQGHAVSESRSGLETSYFSGLVSFKSTAYNSSSFNNKTQTYESTSQTTGMVTLGVPMLNVSYENDWHPASAMQLLNPFGLHPADGGDGADRFRTAALSFNAGVISTGFKLATGDPGPRSKDNTSPFGGIAGTYRMSSAYGLTFDPNRYRLGLGYLAAGPFNIGINGEFIRHSIQNVLVHDRPFQPSPWFEVLPGNNQLYFGYSNGSTTQW